MAADPTRDELELGRLVVRASVYPVLLVSLVAGVLVWQILTLRSLAAWVDHSGRVIAKVNAVTRLMLEHESALRGYLITRRAAMLEPFIAAEKELAPALDDLERLVADDPSEVERTRRFRELYDRWRALAREVPRPGAPAADAATAEGTAERKIILDTFRAESAQFIGAEDRLRSERSARAGRASEIVLVAAVALSLLLGVVLAILARRQLRRVAAMYDQTAQAAAVRAELLTESEERLRLFVEGLHDVAMYVLDPEGRIQSWNVGAERIKGYRPGNIIGRHVTLFYTPEDIAAGRPQRDLADAAAAGQIETESLRVRKDGTRYWAAVTVRCLRGSDGRIIGYAKLERDTTERKRAEMRRSAQYGVARALAEGRSLTDVLPPMLASIGAALGYEVAVAWMPDGDQLRLVADWSRPSPRVDPFLATLRRRRWGRGEGVAGSVWSSGRASWIEDAHENARTIEPDALGAGLRTMLAFPVPAAGKVAMVVQLIAGDPRQRDAELLQVATTLGLQIGTYLERRRAEDEAREAERRRTEDLERRVEDRTVELTAVNRELEAFSYSVSHDLRAPLRAMDGFSQVLVEDYADQLDDTAKDYLGRIRAATQRMSQLIDDLIQLSRVTRSELRREPIDLSQLFREVAGEAQAQEHGRKVELVVMDGIRARGDPRLLRIGLGNLVGNAFKFTRQQPSPRVEFGAEDGKDERVYYVRDNGAGFDSAYADKLFKPFQRLHTLAEFEGTGIGLATWQRIVRRHGGRVWAEGVPGRGAKFSFTLGS